MDLNNTSEKHIAIARHCRYAIAGNTKDPRSIFIVLHGYGQLARFFIRKFSPLYKEHLIIAPEGPHRFYLEGSSGRVGASWMTKEDRLSDIYDNHIMLDAIYDELRADYPTAMAFHIIGFSQGGATAARWTTIRQERFDSLTLWACVYPPDLNIPNETYNGKRFFVIGSNDEYYNDEAQENLKRSYSEKGFEIITYDGNHSIDQDTLVGLQKEFG